MAHASAVLKPLSSLRTHGGRSSVSGATVTVFGGTGFLGRYVINRLGKMGCRVVVPFRGDEIMVRHLKPMGDLGVVNFFDMSIRDPDQIEEAVAGSNIVINLLGKHFETSRWKFQDVHSTFPSVLGTICAEQGVERLVHVSALGASASSPSAWARSKAVGEENVRAAFPEATILRPAPVFGDEDRLLNRIAKLSRAFPVLPLVDGDAQQQPLFCDDFAKALVEAATNRECAGKTYSLCGPKVYTNLQMAEYVFKVSCIDDPCRLTPSRHAAQHHATPRHAARHAPAPHTVLADDRRRQQRHRLLASDRDGVRLPHRAAAQSLAHAGHPQDADRRHDDARGRAGPQGPWRRGARQHGGQGGPLPHPLQEAIHVPGRGRDRPPAELMRPAAAGFSSDREPCKQFRYFHRLVGWLDQC